MYTLKKLQMHKLISVLTIVVGFVLMMVKIYADSEPGAIPMLLVVLGMGVVFHLASPNSVASQVTSRMEWHAR